HPGPADAHALGQAFERHDDALPESAVELMPVSDDQCIVLKSVTHDHAAIVLIERLVLVFRKECLVRSPKYVDLGSIDVEPHLLLPATAESVRARYRRTKQLAGFDGR